MNKEIQKLLNNIPKQKTMDIGDYVFGRVVQVTDKIAIINIFDIDKILTPSSTGILFVNHASSDYVEKVGDVMRIGDVLKAKIIDKDKFEFKLSIAEDQLGVVQAFCSNCKARLNLNSPQERCLNCKTMNFKKIIKK